MPIKARIKHFRKWILKTRGIQDLSNYRGTKTEQIAIEYADAGNSIRNKRSKRLTVTHTIGNTSINPYQLRKAGFASKKIESISGDYMVWSIPIDEPKKHSERYGRDLVYSEDDQTLYLKNVYLNHLRHVDTMEQILQIYYSFTDKVFPGKYKPDGMRFYGKLGNL